MEQLKAALAFLRFLAQLKENEAQFLKRPSMRIATMLLLLLVSGACLNEPVGLGTTVGRWTLQSVNDKPLPFTMSGSGADKTELVSDVLMLYEGFTYDETVTLRTTVNGQATTTTTRKPGPYSLSLGALTFSFNDGTPSKVANVNGNKMTFFEPGFVRVFTK